MRAENPCPQRAPPSAHLAGPNGRRVAHMASLRMRWPASSILLRVEDSLGLADEREKVVGDVAGHVGELPSGDPRRAAHHPVRPAPADPLVPGSATASAAPPAHAALRTFRGHARRIHPAPSPVRPVRPVGVALLRSRRTRPPARRYPSRRGRPARPRPAAPPPSRGGRRGRAGRERPGRPAGPSGSLFSTSPVEPARTKTATEEEPADESDEGVEVVPETDAPAAESPPAELPTAAHRTDT